MKVSKITPLDGHTTSMFPIKINTTEELIVYLVEGEDNVCIDSPYITKENLDKLLLILKKLFNQRPPRIGERIDDNYDVFTITEITYKIKEDNTLQIQVSLKP